MRKAARPFVSLLTAAVILWPHPLLAHEGESTGLHDLHDLWTTWAWEPVSWAGLLLSAWLYTQGLVRLWRTSGIGHGVRRWEASCFAGGWLALPVALVSPLHPWGQLLFSAHMTQHEILMLVAAPLLVLGRPLVVFLWALPPSWARGLALAANTPAWQRFWQVITGAFVAWLIHAAVLWTWHAPLLF